MLFKYIRPGMILDEDIVDERGNLLLERGTVMTDNYLARLKHMHFSQLRVIDIYAESLRPSPAIPKELRQELTLCFRALLSMYWSQEQNAKLRYMYFQKIDSTIKQVISHLDAQIPDIINLAVRQPNIDEVSHAVNVCLLSTITGLYLKFPAAILSELATGALLHDIGNIAMSETLTADNTYLHTIYGHDLLLANKLSPTVARIAAEHHECPDGSGYPMGMLGKDIHPLSRLVAVANYYDEAVSLKSKGLISRQEIVESMMVSGNATFDLNMLRAFFQTIAIYPVGSLVKLNSGKLAYVLKNKTRLPLRPTVQLADASRLEIDLANQPSITIEELIED